jgi:hypothetical protein
MDIQVQRETYSKSIQSHLKYDLYSLKCRWTAVKLCKLARC